MRDLVGALYKCGALVHSSMEYRGSHTRHYLKWRHYHPFCWVMCIVSIIWMMLKGAKTGLLKTWNEVFYVDELINRKQKRRHRSRKGGVKK